MKILTNTISKLSTNCPLTDLLRMINKTPFDNDTLWAHCPREIVKLVVFVLLLSSSNSTLNS